ncbi:hypothetical protein N4R57_12825 [Rhodobacteraceae bacterium D3-12]|nr:hypothetical protein N4R57_12825 [Rhodobacteraceae bacterium D3-12]
MAGDVLTRADLLPETFGAERCFARSYDTAHLKKHPDQRVTDMALYLDYRKFEGFDDPIFGFSVAVKRRGDPRTGTNGGICNDVENGVTCQIDCDGGGILLRKSRTPGAVLVDMTTIWGLALMSCGEDGAEMEPLTAGKDDKVFRLDAAELSACDAARGD